MHILATVLFGLAAAGTVAMAPLWYRVGMGTGAASWAAWIWIALAGAGRGVVTGSGMLALVAGGRLDGMMAGRGMQAAAMLGAVLVVEAAGTAANMVAALAVLHRDSRSMAGLGAIGFLAPALLLAGGLAAAWQKQGTGLLVTAAVGLSVAAGMGSYGWMAATGRAFEARRTAVDARLAEAGAASDVEAVLPFLAERNGRDVQGKAMDRLRELPGAKEHVGAALRGGGPKRRVAMEAAAADSYLREGELEGECWRAVGALARELEERGVREGEEVEALRALFVALAYDEDAAGGPYRAEAEAVRRFAAGMGELETLAEMYLRKK
jgi:hypothetical protein